MALTKHNATEDGRYELTVKIDAADFNKKVDAVYRRENKKINIQGFRKGKTPRAVIERMYGADFFYEDALNELLPTEFDNAITESNIDFIGKPDIDVPDIDKEKGVTIVFTVKLRPALAVGKYKGIAGTRAAVNVEDAEVDAEIDKKLEQASRMVSVDDRAAKNDDITNIDFEGFLDGKAFEGGKGEQHDLTLGAGQFIPGFEEQVLGHNVGDEFDIKVDFPEDYGSEELAGKEATFKIKINEIRVKELPELDDEFAKDVSEFDTLKELREDIKKHLAEHKEEHAKADLENELVDAVTETLEGDVPDEMVDDRVEEMVRDFAYRLRSQGLDMQTYLKYTGADEAAMKEGFKDQALKFVRTRLALEAVARAEKIEVADADIDAELAKLAKQYDMEADKIKDIMPHKELVADIKVGKAIEIIVENAKVKEEKAKAKKAEKAE